MEEIKKNCDLHEEDCDCCEAEEIVELEGDDGKKYKFYFIGTLDYEDKVYAAFEPAEEINGIDDESIVIFELKEVEGDEDASELLPVHDEELLTKVYDAFCDAMNEGVEEGCCCDDDNCTCGDDDCTCGEDGCTCHSHDEK